jgi:ABC-type transporter lipoprotein component MlaA
MVTDVDVDMESVVNGGDYNQFFDCDYTDNQDEQSENQDTEMYDPFEGFNYTNHRVNTNGSY